MPEKPEKRVRKICGARRRMCRDCRYRYHKVNDRELLACPQCGAPRLCANKCKEGVNRCYIHGGASPTGSKSVKFKHGRKVRRKQLAPHLLERVEELKKDQDLLSCRHDIAIAVAYAEKLGEKLDRDQTVPWKVLESLAKELKVAREAGDDVGAQVDMLVKVILQGATAENTWNEYFDHAERVAKLRELETRIQERKNAVMTYEQGVQLVMGILNAIHKRVSDRIILESLSKDIQGLVTFEPPKPRIKE